jgi:hypothetical protein
MRSLEFSIFAQTANVEVLAAASASIRARFGGGAEISTRGACATRTRTNAATERRGYSIGDWWIERSAAR